MDTDDELTMEHLDPEERDELKAELQDHLATLLAKKGITGADVSRLYEAETIPTPTPTPAPTYTPTPTPTPTATAPAAEEAPTEQAATSDRWEAIPGALDGNRQYVRSATPPARL